MGIDGMIPWWVAGVTAVVGGWVGLFAASLASASHVSDECANCAVARTAQERRQTSERVAWDGHRGDLYAGPCSQQGGCECQAGEEA
jgi:hypothetical protein